MRWPYLALCSLAMTAAIPASADPFTYVNARFDTVCTFPEEVFSQPQAEPDNGDGRQWVSLDGASLICSGIYNVTEDTPQSFVASETASQSSNYRITYSKAGRDWVVLSGFKDGNVFYERRLFGSDGVIRTVWIEYPAALKAKYDPLAGEIANSLKGP